jgi:glutamate/tyrosine decarboxylase-like PLP-dependent enzyme
VDFTGIAPFAFPRSIGTGGFIFPFAREFDSTIPEFDFLVPTVKSISVDLHKYAYAAKGISALMLRDKTHADYNRTSFNDWPGGLYSTPNLSGSRSGGAIASAWAVINYLRREGYRNIVQDLIQLRQQFQAGINAIPGLRVVGNPQTFQFAFGSDQFDIYAVADAMEDLNWKIGRAREPHSIQLMINRSHHLTVTTFLSDLEKVSHRVAAGNIKARDIQSVYAN